MDTQRYLDRIGYRGPVRVDVDSLRGLMRAHLFSVPFENFDIHLGVPIVLDYEAIYRKIVDRRRGGFCYEINGLFGHLLGELGFRVDYLSARVGTRGNFGPEFGHIALAVHLDDQSYLVDVAYGDCIREPMPLIPGTVQHALGKEYRLIERDGELCVEVEDSSGYIGGYALSTTPRRLSEFAAMCRYQQTSPLAWFTQKRVCTMALPNGRVTISEATLKIRTDVDRSDHKIASEDEYRAAIRRYFHMDLARVPVNRSHNLLGRLHRQTVIWRRRAARAASLIASLPVQPIAAK